jgi:hypothetical protein
MLEGSLNATHGSLSKVKSPKPNAKIEAHERYSQPKNKQDATTKNVMFCSENRTKLDVKYASVIRFYFLF